ncbi:hypothetical protein I3843_01G212800 [Carya illinoinensis]|uniref:LsmAD domain-containing protein n=1 Tax=Carya illinoinensis TaxID=32201 RepID=A0A8T1RPM9_CARIL|nr:polyadenylate-binding protein-interacting protein 3-like [Carya illinoinensis]XP_042948083.1 polyadenylate-binding protein-interacting protein 3-like [Carya illinoinensis]XP_042948091.1 polyadenylate-binding protein-interacting protein 3-like [Carya illinoinensis]KAG6669116.1 hypothetical protein CIPAW_01G221000 [Carya illinoinensis]KAG6669117.1 hypothetical protein CIPAW_01G221000 [Carya illinoinensis]KAG6669118.1 hypothetical protein CIPAW_01G221000 [Carya illinoinensis]KAG6669119.1 hypo
MNMQQAVQHKSSANGFGRRRGDREVGTRLENKLQSGKSNPSRSTNTGAMTGGKLGSGGPSLDRIVYITTCLIGHHVEVQVKDGSIYTGIFHATNSENDFGVILKMARMKKDCSLRGLKATAESVSKAPSKTLIIQAKELVQVSAKGVSVTREELSHEVQGEKQQEIMLDFSISQSRYLESDRELEPWVPDKDCPRHSELENIFDGHWNRGWDQFETNETLFGVKSTFDEELYTTKLERGPKMEELEKKALRIAREIEGEETQDLHLAEERGISFPGDLEIDEETRFSSVYRGKGVDDSGYEEHEAILIDSCNNETFGGSGSDIKRSTDLTIGESSDGAPTSSSSSFKDQTQSSQSSTSLDSCRSGSYDHAKQLASDPPFKSFTTSSDGENRIQENPVIEQHGGNNNAQELAEKKTLADDAQFSKPEDSRSLLNVKKDGSDLGGLSRNVAASYASSSGVPLKGHEKMNSSGEQSESVGSVKMHGETESLNSRGQPGSSTSSSSDSVGGAPVYSGPGLSPSSSMGSLSSEKSTLNPHAKEFKLNPNAKSFVPSQTPVRPRSPVSDGSFYFPPNVSAVPHMPGMQMGIGIGHSFPGHQPVVFNPQVPMQSPPAFYHANGPQYGPQMLVRHPTQVVYYQHEMPYKGRDF